MFSINLIIFMVPNVADGTPANRFVLVLYLAKVMSIYPDEVLLKKTWRPDLFSPRFFCVLEL